MSDEGTLDPRIAEYRLANVVPARAEFDAAINDHGEVTAEHARKYMRVLNSYEQVVLDSPHAPGSGSVRPSAHDSATRRGAGLELTWIESERARILDQFGGSLVMDPDD